MSLYQEFSERMRSAGRSMPVRPLDYDAFIGAARSRRRLYLVGAASAVLCVLGLLTAGVLSITGTARQSQPVDPAAPDSLVTEERVRPVLGSFVDGLRTGDTSATWDLLTPRAQDELGSLDEWRKRQGDVRYLFTWIGERPFDLYVTPVLEDTAIVTAAETEPHRDSWLLSTFTVQDVSGELLFDLDLRREISLLPEVPRIVSLEPCSGEGCPSLESLRPEISDGQDLSVLLSPPDQVSEVWFGLGGDSWVTEADLTEADEGVRATVAVDTGNVPRETVFVVAIVRTDGGIDSYGYRVVTDP